MKTKDRPLHFAGFDWAKTHHDVTGIDANGEIVIEFRFDHHADGWRVPYRENCLRFHRAGQFYRSKMEVAEMYLTFAVRPPNDAQRDTDGADNFEN